MLCFTPSVFLVESLLKWHLILVTCLSPLRPQKGVGGQKLKIHQENKTTIKSNWHLPATASDTKSTAGLRNMGVYCYWISVEKKKEHYLLSFSLRSTETNALLCPAKYTPTWLQILLLGSWKIVQLVQTVLLSVHIGHFKSCIALGFPCLIG